jgi:hypothetical protein
MQRMSPLTRSAGLTAMALVIRSCPMKQGLVFIALVAVAARAQLVEVPPVSAPVLPPHHILFQFYQSLVVGIRIHNGQLPHRSCRVRARTEPRRKAVLQTHKIKAEQTHLL